MKIFNNATNNFPITYKNAEYIFYYYECIELENEVNQILASLQSTNRFHITIDKFYSEKIPSVSGRFIIGKREKQSEKFPYPFILDCHDPILIEVDNNKIIKMDSLSELVSQIIGAFKNSNEMNMLNTYNKLCLSYGKEFLEEFLPYEDIIYYFN